MHVTERCRGGFQVNIAKGPLQIGRGSTEIATPKFDLGLGAPDEPRLPAFVLFANKNQRAIRSSFRVCQLLKFGIVHGETLEDPRLKKRTF